MQAAEIQRTHTITGSIDLSLETVIRKIMLRRLLSLRGATKTEKNEEETKTTAVENEKNNNIDNNKTLGDHTDSENKDNFKEEIVIEDGILPEPIVSNKLIGGELTTAEEEEQDEQEEMLITNEDENADSKPDHEEPGNEEEKETETEEVTIESEVDKSDGEQESKDKEKEIDGDVNKSSESLMELEIEFHPESCKSDANSDSEGKDSGIEKGESPPLPSKETTDSDEDGGATETDSYKPAQPQTFPDIRTSSFVGPTTVNVLSPANTKPKRLVKRSKSARRSRQDIDLDSELSCDSSPEKRFRKKNMTVSYLSYPQRFVRSSLAVEARLSQWRKESSVVENSRVEMPARNGILKQPMANRTTTPQRVINSGLMKGRQASRDVSFHRGRHSDSDTSSEDEGRMSVRKIYSSKSALRRRIENLEGMLLSMATQKAGLQELIVTMEMWSLELSHVDRTKLGVPYIRSVKDVLKKQRHSMISKKSNFNQLISRLQEAKVPCFEQVNKIIKQLNKEVCSIVQDRKRYSSRHIEDIRQLQGNIIGTCKAVTAVFYEE